MDTIEIQDWMNEDPAAMQNTYMPSELVEDDSYDWDVEDKIDDRSIFEIEDEGKELNGHDDNYPDDSEYLESLLPVDVFMRKAMEI
jgi:hypothetical protein